MDFCICGNLNYYVVVIASLKISIIPKCEKFLATGKVINRFKNFIDRAVLTIKSGILPCNEYNLQVTIKGTQQNSKILNVKFLQTIKTLIFLISTNITLQCWFKINTAGPVPIITGGQYKNAISGDVVTFDGTTTDESGLQDLKYIWKCTSNTSQSFCSKFTSRGLYIVF